MSIVIICFLVLSYVIGAYMIFPDIKEAITKYHSWGYAIFKIFDWLLSPATMAMAIIAVLLNVFEEIDSCFRNTMIDKYRQKTSETITIARLEEAGKYHNAFIRGEEEKRRLTIHHIRKLIEEGTNVYLIRGDKLFRIKED